MYAKLQDICKIRLRELVTSMSNVDTVTFFGHILIMSRYDHGHCIFIIFIHKLDNFDKIMGPAGCAHPLKTTILL